MRDLSFAAKQMIEPAAHQDMTVFFIYDFFPPKANFDRNFFQYNNLFLIDFLS